MKFLGKSGLTFLTAELATFLLNVNPATLRSPVLLQLYNSDHARVRHRFLAGVYSRRMLC
jgi:hypothetical protein